MPLKQTLKLNNFPESEIIRYYSFAIHVSERRKYLKKNGQNIIIRCLV